MGLATNNSALLALVAVAVTAVLAQRGGGGGATSTCMTQYPNAVTELTSFASTGAASNDLKCYMSCVLLAKGRMSSNGTIARNGTPANLPASTAAATATCFQMTPASDLCETAYQHSKCLWTNDPERLFLRLYRGGGGRRQGGSG